jgi:hypothetical protein
MHDDANDNKSSKRKEKDGKEERKKGVNAVIWVQDLAPWFGMPRFHQIQDQHHHDIL